VRRALAGRGWWIALVLLVAAIVFGSLQAAPEEGRSPQNTTGDQTTFGFSAWATLLDRSGLSVEEITTAPSDGRVDPNTTLIAMDIGSPTAEDVEALREFVDSGGYLVTGGNTDAAAIEEITGLEPGEADASGGIVIPILPVAQTEGIASVDTDGGEPYGDPGGGLPVLGSDAGSLVILGEGRGEPVGEDPATGTGQVALVSSSNPMQNGQLTFADNAQFAIDVARAGGGNRPVLFAENLAVDVTPGEGASALPRGWDAAFIGLVLAALTFVVSRVRRLGPPDGDPTPPARRRSDYIDAMARILARRGSDLPAATEPVRQAAIQGIAQRSGGRPAGDDADMLAAQAELAGVPADEAEALSGPLKEPEDAIRAARALNRVRR
jgi:hypothetical protein